MDLIRIGLLIFTGLILIACESLHPAVTSSPTLTTVVATVTAVPTMTMRHTHTSTSTPARFITATPKPTKVRPTPIASTISYPPGVPSGVPVPQPAEAISPENVTRVTELARWGKGTISNVAYSEDGKTLSVTSSVGTYFHDARSLKEIGYSQSLDEIQTEAASQACSATANYQEEVIACSPDNQTAVVGGPGFLRLISIDKRVLKTVEFPEEHQWESAQKIVFVSQLVVALGVESGTIFIWHLNDDALIVIPGFGGGNLAISPDGMRIVAGYEDGWVRLYDARDGKLIRTLKGHDIGETWAVFSPDGATLVTASHDGVIRLWRASDGEFLQSLPGHANPAPVPPVVFNQEVLASASGRTIQIRQLSDGSIRQMFEVPENGNPRRNFEGPVGRVINLALSPDGSTLASGMDDGLIHLWRVADGSLIKTLDNECSLWGRIGFSPDAQILATKGYWLNCLTAHLLRVNDGEPVLSFDLDHRSLVDALMVFTPDGYNVVVTNNQGLVESRRIMDGVVQRSFEGHHDRINDLVFSPDGRLMATASQDRSTRWWDVASGNLLFVLDQAAAGEVVRLAFSPQGDLLVTASSSGTIGFWRVVDGTFLYALHGLGKVDSLGFPSDRLLLTSLSDGTIRLWGIPASRQ